MRAELSPQSLNHLATVSQALLVLLLGSGELDLQVIDSTTTEGKGIEISLGGGGFRGHKRIGAMELLLYLYFSNWRLLVIKSIIFNVPRSVWSAWRTL